ncbi:hypothetical protein MUK70_06430 [Dyadobacter chenwenxiniae]|uniref:Uncharacterized protein n=1 Tax=Dyadobacter chenwenxiniae TaxID=2906456 RepID=A0A9X1PRE2_9BACT|nr:hypothetical protein [Dyadobacter chenwenxiniae]MCF0065105.1 hypothetical protein [Dyadobacter chenwenxiniae]UON84623.1 hypothetical protein MUK70_06430 [Dyadobacter chenwenxiniae]
MPISKTKSIPSGRRRKLSLYTKHPFGLTESHYKAFLRSMEDLRFVDIKYKLTLDRIDIQRLEFGGKEADLDADQGDDDDVFENEDAIEAPVTDGMLWVVVRARKRSGTVGGSWSLEVKVNGQNLSDFPIEEDVAENNRADHDELHDL